MSYNDDMREFVSKLSNIGKDIFKYLTDNGFHCNRTSLRVSNDVFNQYLYTKFEIEVFTQSSFFYIKNNVDGYRYDGDLININIEEFKKILLEATKLEKDERDDEDD